MDNELIIKAAMCTVGAVQMLKNFITLKNPKLWGIFVIIIGFGLSVLGEYVNEKILDVTLVVCLASLFYDSIFKGLENLAHSIGAKKDGTVTDNTPVTEDMPETRRD